jgi:LmbE family N-acetylglucosaminyl deacetylase
MPLRDGEALGTLLGVWGHPDDEAYLSAGLMAQAVAAGHRVVCVTATRGEAGFPDDDPRSVAERIAVRESEMAACLQLLGVREHRWLPYGDGRCDEVDVGEAVDLLCAIIDDVRPRTVLTFGPDGQTGHPDHIAASRWTTLAFRKVADPDARLLYATQTPEWNARIATMVDLDQIMMVDDMELPSTEPSELAVWAELDGELLDRKVAALRSQASQVEPLYQQMGPAGFALLARDEFFRDATHDDWPD